jgi:hypothetical protein
MMLFELEPNGSELSYQISTIELDAQTTVVF